METVILLHYAESTLRLDGAVEAEQNAFFACDAFQRCFSLLYEFFGNMELTVALGSGAAFLMRTVEAIIAFIVSDLAHEAGFALALPYMSGAKLLPSLASVFVFLRVIGHVLTQGHIALVLLRNCTNRLKPF